MPLHPGGLRVIEILKSDHGDALCPLPISAGIVAVVFTYYLAPKPPGSSYK